MNNIVATSSGGPHRPGELSKLADMGFTHVVAAGVAADATWEAEVAEAHRVGLKFIARWPNWSALGMIGPAHAFRAWDGRDNSIDNLVQGPSVWNREAAEAALMVLPGLVGLGIDGVLVHILVGDRPMPTAWYMHIGSTPHTRAWWCHDEWAKADWGDRGPLPDLTKNGMPDGFYRWYQGAWLARLREFTNPALQLRVHNVWSWFIPLVYDSAETLATATARSEQPLKEWMEAVRVGGGDPVLVTAHLFGIGFGGDQPYDLVRRMSGEVPLICGVEADRGLDTVLMNGRRLRQWGAGIFSGDQGFLANPQRGGEVVCSWLAL
jgi:hypothetical protein